MGWSAGRCSHMYLPAQTCVTDSQLRRNTEGITITAFLFFLGEFGRVFFARKESKESCLRGYSELGCPIDCEIRNIVLIAGVVLSLYLVGGATRLVEGRRGLRILAI